MKTFGKGVYVICFLFHLYRFIFNSENNQIRTYTVETPFRICIDRTLFVDLYSFFVGILRQMTIFQRILILLSDTSTYYGVTKSLVN